MNVYLALYDEPQRNTIILGAFSTEEAAQAACQQAENEDESPATLTWDGDMAMIPAGCYWSRLVTLDERTSA